MNLIVVFLQKAIAQGIAILYGANGEIVTEKSGNLNLGVPGMMYMGGVAGLMGAFLYENSVEAPVPFVGMLIALVCALVCSGLGALIYSVLTISLRANQNVTGLALTTFGVGFGNFLGGSIMKLTGQTGQITVYLTGKAFKATFPFATSEAVTNSPFLRVICRFVFLLWFFDLLCAVVALLAGWFLARTRVGLNLRAVGESRRQRMQTASTSAAINMWPFVLDRPLQGWAGCIL